MAEQETKLLEYIELRPPLLNDPTLNGDEKMLLYLVEYYDNKGGLYASNETLGKYFGWKPRKVQDVFARLFDMKRIMYARKSLHAPRRKVYLYNISTICAHRKGCYTNSVFEFLDYKL